MSSVIVIGGTGQAKVIRPIIESLNYKITAVFDDTPNLHSPYDDVEIYGSLLTIDEYLIQCKELPKFVIAIGNPHGVKRIEIHKKLMNLGLDPINLISSSAYLEENVEFEDGLQVMPGAVVMSEVRLGLQCIINTKASLDHECVIQDGCEIGPGATLCGKILLKNHSWIGAGATVLPRRTIGTNSIVGAGAVVVKDVPDNVIVAGNPAKVLRTL